MLLALFMSNLFNLLSYSKMKCIYTQKSSERYSKIDSIHNSLSITEFGIPEHSVVLALEGCLWKHLQTFSFNRSRTGFLRNINIIASAVDERFIDIQKQFQTDNGGRLPDVRNQQAFTKAGMTDSIKNVLMMIMAMKNLEFLNI